MSLTSDLRIALHEVGVALRRPEEFTLRWRDRRLTPGPRPLIVPELLANAVLGIAAYGLVMRLHEGWGGMLGGLVKAPVAAPTGPNDRIRRRLRIRTTQAGPDSGTAVEFRTAMPEQY